MRMFANFLGATSSPWTRSTRWRARWSLHKDLANPWTGMACKDQECPVLTCYMWSLACWKSCFFWTNAQAPRIQNLLPQRPLWMAGSTSSEHSQVGVPHAETFDVSRWHVLDEQDRDCCSDVLCKFFLFKSKPQHQCPTGVHETTHALKESICGQTDQFYMQLSSSALEFKTNYEKEFKHRLVWDAWIWV